MPATSEAMMTFRKSVGYCNGDAAYHASDSGRDAAVGEHFLVVQVGNRLSGHRDTLALPRPMTRLLRPSPHGLHERRGLGQGHLSFVVKNREEIRPRDAAGDVVGRGGVGIRDESLVRLYLLLHRQEIHRRYGRVRPHEL